jgi:hypothetical protein
MKRNSGKFHFMNRKMERVVVRPTGKDKIINGIL